MNSYDVGTDYRGFAYTHNHATTTTNKRYANKLYVWNSQ